MRYTYLLPPASCLKQKNLVPHQCENCYTVRPICYSAIAIRKTSWAGYSGGKDSATSTRILQNSKVVAVIDELIKA